jgi:hypothetical protein
MKGPDLKPNSHKPVESTTQISEESKFLVVGEIFLRLPPIAGREAMVSVTPSF